MRGILIDRPCFIELGLSPEEVDALCEISTKDGRVNMRRSAAVKPILDKLDAAFDRWTKAENQRFWAEVKRERQRNEERRARHT